MFQLVLGNTARAGNRDVQITAISSKTHLTELEQIFRNRFTRKQHCFIVPLQFIKGKQKSSNYVEKIRITRIGIFLVFIKCLTQHATILLHK